MDGSVSFTGDRYALPEYPFRMPPEMAGGDTRRYCVAIVGAGLTGLTAACALADLGIDVVVLDDDNSVGSRGVSSRGVCYAQKSLEIFARLGVYPKIREKGVTWTVGRSYAGDDEVYRFEYAPDARDVSAQPAFINLQQFYIESFLVQRVMQLPAAELRWCSRVLECMQHEHGARLRVETPAGEYSLAADWVIDCSGTRSALRGNAGARTQKARTDDRWLICDVLFEKPPPCERRTWLSAPFNDGRAAWQHVMADGVCRVDYQLDPGCDIAQESSESAIRQRLRRQFGDAHCQIIWVGAWSYRSECLANFRAGRVLFAGDAAHVMAPFGGRGGNSGIQDADNLAWKLAQVVRQQADAALLDTYCEERRVAAQENIRIADRTTRFLHPATAVERSFRDTVLELARSHGFARSLVNAGRMSQPNAYAGSRLNVGWGGGQSVPNVATALADGSPGDLTRLLRWANGCHVAVVRSPTARHRALEQRYPVRVLTAEKLGAGFAALLGATGGNGASAMVLRPDSYCAGCLASDDAADLESAFRTLSCR